MGQRTWYDRKVRRVRDLSCGDLRIYLEFEVRWVQCRRCGGVKQEQLTWLAANPHYALLGLNQLSVQTDAIRDNVLPLIEVDIDEAEAGVTLRCFVGSAFLIGRRSFAITAAHVVASPKRIAVAFATPTGWFAHPIAAIETHPSEDVAVFRVKTENLRSICRVVGSRENSGLRYMQFAYPEEMMFELPHDGRTDGRPDLVYLEGYIRRRTNHQIPAILGQSLYEVSAVAGSGCSGSPIIRAPRAGGGVWNVIGVYVGEKVNERGVGVGYAVRSDAFSDWIPEILGCSVIAECEA